MDAVPVVEYGRRRTLIIAGVMLAALLQTLDSTIVNVALPTIEGNVGASIDDGTWIVTGYIISNVVAIPLAPFLMQRWGRRQYYATSIIGFTVASLLCGTADSLALLVCYRIVQGAFGGGLIATSQIILRETLPAEKLGASSALFALALTLGPALGPTLGGALTDNFSWQWIFEINVLPGALAALIILTTLRNPAAPRRLPFDGVGLGLLIVGLGSMQYVLDEGERNDWFGDGRIVFFTAACIVGLLAFIAWELWGTTTPIVDVRVFRYRNVAVGVGSAILLGGVVFGPTVMLPQYTQGILGFTAMLSGLLMLMRAVPVLCCTPLVARFATRVDVRVLLVMGASISGLSFALVALRMTTGSAFGTFAPALLISGVGQSMLLVPLLVGVIGGVRPIDAPKASSFISLSFQLGASIASTMLVTIFDRRTYFHADVLRSAATMANPAVREQTSLPHALAVLARLVQQQATNAGFADAIFALIPVCALAVGLVLFLRRPATALAAPVVAAE